MSMSSISVDKLAQNSHKLSRAELKRLQSELNPSQIGAKLSWDTTILTSHCTFDHFSLGNFLSRRKIFYQGEY